MNFYYTIPPTLKKILLNTHTEARTHYILSLYLPTWLVGLFTHRTAAAKFAYVTQDWIFQYIQIRSVNSASQSHSTSLQQHVQHNPAITDNEQCVLNWMDINPFHSIRLLFKDRLFTHSVVSYILSYLLTFLFNHVRQIAALRNNMQSRIWPCDGMGQQMPNGVC